MKGTNLRSARSRLLATVAVTALAGLAALGGLAIAHDRVYSNAVTLTKADRLSPAVGVYRGRVTSGKPNCKRRREVQIYRADVTPEVRILTFRTDNLGRWNRKGPALPDGAKVYALIETKAVPPLAGHDHNCPVDRSPVRTIPYP